MPTTAEIFNHCETSVLRIDVVARIPDLYFITRSELKQKIAQYQEVINLSRPLMSYFAPHFDNRHLHLNLIDPDGCILHSLVEEHVGAVCPGFIYINNNPAIKESLLNGTIVDLYSVEANEGLVSMPILTGKSAVCLTVTNMKGRVSGEYLRMALFMYQMINAQLGMITAFNQAADALLDISDDPTLVVDESGLLTGANTKLLELLGIDSREALRGIHAGEIIDNYESLFAGAGPRPGDRFKVHIRSRSTSAELICCRNMQMPAGGRHTVLSFRCPALSEPIPAPLGPSLQADAFQGIIGISPQMRLNIAIAQRVARLPSTVLIEGESGTGKELIARGIHRASGRKGSFVAINCGSISRELLYSELFGYAEGAFTGARKGGMTGKLKQADGGTVFLDEIGEMSEEMQVSLLRFMQDKVVIPLGDGKPQKVDVRIIAATNRNLAQEVERGNFREDLFYRLNVVNIKMPPLRERKEDIPLLARYILQEISTEYRIPAKELTRDGLKKLSSYDWPGNVRELRNVIERAMVVSSGEQITADDLLIETGTRPVRLTELEKSTIVELLQRHGGNITATAKSLGIARSTLYRKMKKYGIPG
ncbi:MAG: sigma 54-interacting transcriptional regulator [Syntrophomonadaceae bacterium]|nr:sigma 54-interacting transcriptional regulator [Syntrophomonadaceae bacterium]